MLKLHFTVSAPTELGPMSIECDEEHDEGTTNTELRIAVVMLRHMRELMDQIDSYRDERAH